jgi:hypothetical protein
MKRKIVATILSLTIVVGLSTSVLVKAALPEGRGIINVAAATGDEEIISESRRLVEQALTERTFYKYNVAYAAINKINDAAVKESLLGQLGVIAGVVWTDDVKKFNSMLDNLVKTNGSGEIYDKIQAEVGNSSLADVDQAYLLGELTSWGRRIVYTTDYGSAVNSVVSAWNKLEKGTEAEINLAISNAERAIGSVKNGYSKNYLLGQLKQIKDQTEFTVVEIN